jgi:hypothetical protein
VKSLRLALNLLENDRSRRIKEWRALSGRAAAAGSGAGAPRARLPDAIARLGIHR